MNLDASCASALQFVDNNINLVGAIEECYGLPAVADLMTAACHKAVHLLIQLLLGEDVVA